MSLVFALAASAQELPSVEQQDGGAAAKLYGDMFLSVWTLYWSFYLWLCPIWNSGGKEGARDGRIPTDETSQSSLEEREAKIEMQCEMRAYIAATDFFFFFFWGWKYHYFPIGSHSSITVKLEVCRKGLDPF